MRWQTAARPLSQRCRELRQFHQDEPFLKRSSGLRSASKAYALVNRTPRHFGGDGTVLFTDGAYSAEPEETTMLRKLSLVAVAAASLGAAALAPTSASAWGGWHGGWHHGWGGPRVFVGGPTFYGYGYGGC